MLRLLWSVVEQTQSTTLLELNDTDLVKQLLRQIDSKTVLNTEEIHTVSTYLSSRTELIRDLAIARLA
ncbi:hypothetical protein [Nostoc sp. TCL26-01]|uniref:hypothetical protein n=1 Tax=Nostoc sp. TCL26-01 TaxID=2576904 RepID=UPI00277B4EBB|nr:hypothetical protein [Nostoc sp. TCL26-01]